MKMLETAANHRWAISNEYRTQAVETLVQILGSAVSTDREKIAATRALVAMDCLNQKDEHDAKLQSDRNRFLALAERLGIRENVEPSPEGGTSVAIEGTVVGPKRKRPRPKAKKKSTKQGRRGNNKSNS
tara:strand:- start:28135 stop:28521 length:387 start_codon:yes stop_codon:yes gene_type:complete